MIGKYDDIIHLPHYVSTTRPQMPIKDRAAQFAPFAALTGHAEAIKETARVTEQRRDLDEYLREEIGIRLQIITMRVKEGPLVEITYFRPDNKKSGGAYETVRGRIKKINEYACSLNLMIKGDGLGVEELLEMEIPFEEIIHIESEIFKNRELE